MSQISAEHAGHGSQVAHHFDSAGQQFSSGKLGMWLFLATEVLFFGGLFTFYSVWRANHPEIFDKGSLVLDWKLGAANTIVLILSSFTMAWGVTAAQQGKIKLLKILLSLTIVGGATFMVIKGFEYNAKWSHGTLWAAAYTAEDIDHVIAGDHEAAVANGATENNSHSGSTTEFEIVPLIGGDSHESDLTDADQGAAEQDQPAHANVQDRGWDPYSGAHVEITQTQFAPAAEGTTGLAGNRRYVARSEADPKDIATYFSIYFCLTGLHGIHVLVGIGLISWLLWRATRGEFGPRYFTPVDLVGLYWHLVDLIWIFLFPLLYLI